MDCDRLQAFHDGELAPAEAAAFRVHLAGCERCGAGLMQLMQLGALADETGRDERKVVPLRRPRRVLWLAVPALAAAAALTVWMVRKPAAPVVAEVVLAPARSLEARVSWQDGDRFRPYAVNRSSEAPGEVIPLKTLAGLEADPRALAGAYLLMGDEAAAAQHLDKAPASADRDSDRAALKLAEGKPEEALALATAALEVDAGHGPAAWNRALALRDLGLPLGAAAAFAAIREPGWREEGQARAARLRDEAERTAKSYQQIIAAGAALVQDGTPLPDALVAAHPATARIYFEQALRAAPDAERARALDPLARALDQRFGGHGLSEQVTRVSTSDFAVRAPLAAIYAAVVRGERQLSAAEALPLVTRATGSDLALGFLLSTPLAGERPELLAAAATASADPWFIDTVASRAVLAAKGPDAQRAVLSAGLEGCRSAYRCAQLAYLEGELLITRFHRPVAAAPLFTRARRDFAAWGDWLSESRALLQFGQAAHARGQLDLAAVHYEEGLLRAGFMASGVCEHRRWASTLLVSVEITRLRFERARARMAEVPRCEGAVDPSDLLLVADLARFGLSEAAGREMLADLESLRGTPIADYLEGRLRAASDRAAAEPLLRRAIDRAGDELLDRQARHFAFQTLIALASQAGEHDRVVGLFAEEARIAMGERCVLGVESDDDRVVVAARPARGPAIGALRTRSRVDEPVTALVPAHIVAALRECPLIDVIAFAPHHGSPLLPADVAWRFVSAGPSGALPSGEKRLIVADPEPPASLGLPRLAEWPGTGDAVRLTGATATPSRVLAEMQSATDVEIHAHGLVNSDSDTSSLALSPEADGDFSLSASDLAGVKLAGRPLVVLAACETTETAPYLHELWSLPAALVAAGARAVLASSAPLPDAEAGKFFAGVRSRVASGASIAAAVRDERVQWLARDAHSWARDVVVFESASPLAK